MKPFEKCPVCGGELENQPVEKRLGGVKKPVIMKVCADVCQQCGEALYTQEQIHSFESIRAEQKKALLGHYSASGLLSESTI